MFSSAADSSLTTTNLSIWRRPPFMNETKTFPRLTLFNFSSASILKSNKRIPNNNLSRALYLSPRFFISSHFQISKWIKTADVAKVEQAVYLGKGAQTKGRPAWNEEVRKFLQTVPNIMVRNETSTKNANKERREWKEQALNSFYCSPRRRRSTLFTRPRSRATPISCCGR